MLTSILNTIKKNIYITTVFFSLSISLWLFASRDIISSDAVLYLQSSQAFLNGGFIAAFKAWKWPFYPICIAITHEITGFSLENSAYFLTIILETTISITFIKIYSKVAFDGARLWVAMLFILTFVTLSRYKGDIWREYGFWAFSLIAIYHYILYFQRHKIMNAVIWQFSIAIATLFRLEGIVLAALAPFYFLLTRTNSFSERIKCFFSINSILFSIGLLAIVIPLFSVQVKTIIFNNLPPHATFFFAEAIISNFNQAASNLTKYVLPYHYSEEYSPLILASGLASMLIFNLIEGFNLIYTGILVSGIYKHWIKNKHEITIIYYFCIIALLILTVLVAAKMFISTRYTVFLLLLTGLVFVQYLDYLLYYLRRNNHKKWLIALSIFIAIQFLDSIISTGAKKLPIEQSSKWLIHHIKPGEKIACNGSRFNYYTQQNCLLSNNRFLENYTQSDIQFLKRNNYSYILLWVSHKNTIMLESLKNDKHLLLLNSFKNKKNGMGLVYKIKSEE